MESLSDRYARLVSEGRLTADAAQEAVLPEFSRIEQGLSQPVKRGWFRRTAAPEIKGLYLWGGVGRGKSMLMDLFVEGLDVPSRRVHFHAFMQEIHAGMHKARAEGVEDALAPVAKQVVDEVRLLAFDEMQITDITDAMIVGRLFEALFAAGVVVVTTSNRVPDDLYKNGLNRAIFVPFIALIKDRMVVREMAGPTDYRQDRLAGSPVWFTPIGPKTREAMQEIWQDLAGGAAGELVIPVQ